MAPPLSYASFWGLIPSVQTLLESGADVNAEGGFFGSALQAASHGNYKEIVCILLQRNVNVNTNNGWYGNALQAASRNGCEEIIHILLDKGADIHAQGGHFGNAIMAAICSGRKHTVHTLLKRGADIDAQYGKYGNPLQNFSMQGNEWFVQWVLDEGANVNAKGNEYLGPALHIASLDGHEGTVRILLERGADVNAHGGCCGSALQAAVSGGYEEIAQILRENGADVNAGQFNTMDIRSWSEPRSANTKEMHFYDKPYSPPSLAYGLNWLDIDAESNIRINATVSNINTNAFTAGLNSWADTILYSAGMTWLKLGPKFSFLQTGSFNTQEVRVSDDLKPQTAKRIKFSQSFTQPPDVVVFLTGLDLDSCANWRVKAYATDVDSNGFTIHVDSWADTVLYSAGVTWIAHPQNSPGFVSGRFSTNDVRASSVPQQRNTGTARFSTPFKSVPRIMMALGELDYKCGVNLRCRLSTSFVTRETLTWHLQAWHDSVMYAASASYIAWE